MIQARRRPGGLYGVGFGLVVAFTAVAIFYPFYWMVMASVEPEGSSMANVSLLIPHGFSLDAYKAVLQRKPMPLWILNTFIVTRLRKRKDDEESPFEFNLNDFSDADADIDFLKAFFDTKIFSAFMSKDFSSIHTFSMVERK